MKGIRWTDNAFDYALAGIVVVTAVAPLILLAFTPAPAPDAFGQPVAITATPKLVQLVTNSILLTVFTTLFAAIWALPAALYLARVQPRRAPYWALFLALPVFLPPYVLAVAWVDALSAYMPATLFASQSLGQGMVLPRPFDMVGASVIQSLCLYPIALLGAWAGLSRTDQRALDAACLIGGIRTRLAVACWPAMRGAFAASLAVTGLLALIAFPVPSLLLVEVYPVEIYTTFNLTYDAREAARMALPLAAMGLLLLGVLHLAGRDLRREIQRTPLRPVDVPAWLHGAAWLWMGGTITLAMGVPIAALVQRAWPLSSFVEAWVTAREEMATSLLVSTLTASIVTALVVAVGFLTRFGSRAAARSLNATAVTLLLSGPITGIALIGFWNRPVVGPLVYDTLVVLVIACAARTLFIAWRIAESAITRLPNRWDEAAAVAGLTRWRQAWHIHLPPLVPVFGFIWCLVFAFTFTEADATVLVVPPGWTTLPIRIYTLMHYGPSRLVAALSLVTVAVVLAVGIMALQFARRGPWFTHVPR